MARLARHNAQLRFPADAPLTPGTLDAVKALTQRRELLLPGQELLAEGSVLPLEIPIHGDTLVSPLRHMGTPSCVKGCDRAKTRKKVLSPLQSAYYTNR